MARFTNQAQLRYGDSVANSNIAAETDGGSRSTADC